jgi:hypothetical protein
LQFSFFALGLAMVETASCEVVMRLAKISAILGFAWLLSLPVGAEEIGRATVGGRAVILDANGTWAYANVIGTGDATNQACSGGNLISSKKLPISLCLALPWRVDTTPTGSIELQATQTELDLFVGLITERTQLPLETLRQAILLNAASAAGVRPEDVPILKESVETLNGFKWQYIEYELSVSGAKFRFGNYHQTLGEIGVVQIAFWSTAAYFDQSKPAMLAMMDGVKLDVAK